MMNQRVGQHDDLDAMTGYVRVQEAVMTLDATDSNGHPGRPLPVATGRPMALSLKENLWYGFAIRQANVAVIGVGDSVPVRIEFLNADVALPSGCSLLFGDGQISRGTLVLRPKG